MCVHACAQERLCVSVFVTITNNEVTGLHKEKVYFGSWFPMLSVVG